VTGAAGFIGSHVVDRLLERGWEVLGIDNLRLGRRSNLDAAFGRGGLTLIEADVNDAANLGRVQEWHASHPVDRVWHLAANSDIRAGTEDPQVDFEHTFLTTFNVLKLMRALGVRELVFSSSSAIYGPRPGCLDEETGPCFPISNYGAMKLASEGAISAALETHLDRAWIVRFPNVVGSRSTHGVIVDLIRKLRARPDALEVLGDGQQEKPYVHVSELADAMLFIVDQAGDRLNCFNVGADGSATKVSRIAGAVIDAVAPGTPIRYTGGAQGWPGDVPRFQYSIERLRRLGWAPRLTSDQAVERAVAEVASELMAQPGRPG